jgi:putative FmdB family regulatory protein
MPTYDYKCNKCEHQWEDFYSMANMEQPITEPCPECKEEGHVIKCVTSPGGVVIDDNNRRQLENPKGPMKEILQRVKDSAGVKGTKWSKGSSKEGYDSLSDRL